MRVLITLITVLTLCTVGFAQVATDDPYKTTPIIDKLADIDMANQVLPLLLTKDQMSKLLPIVEKCRANVRAQQKKEADRLKELLPEIDKIHGEALKGIVPPEPFLKKVDDLLKKFDNERRGVSIANGLIIFEALDKNLNDGQKKAAAGVVDKVFDSQNKEWKDGTQSEKLKFFGSSIFLSDRAYAYLTKLEK
ncbi:MAG TPA: hypothetical protein VFG65_05740 [Fimbriimonadales bacterium]|nr:hypothetical protein [Fimbriimonadales bacterium]